MHRAANGPDRPGFKSCSSCRAHCGMQSNLLQKVVMSIKLDDTLEGQQVASVIIQVGVFVDLFHCLCMALYSIKSMNKV